LKIKFSRLFIVLVLLADVHSAAAQGSAFTYQGRLNDGANAANGIYDLRFKIFDASSAGTQQGGLLTNSATAVLSEGTQTKIKPARLTTTDMDATAGERRYSAQA